MIKGTVLSVTAGGQTAGVQILGGPSVTATVLTRPPFVGSVVLLHDLGNGSWVILGTIGGSPATGRSFVTSGRTAGDIAANNVNWTNVDTGTDLVLAAVAGDRVTVGVSIGYDGGAVNIFMDLICVASGTHWSTDGGATGTGIFALWGANAVAGGHGATVMRTLAAGDISGGNVTVRLQYRTGAAVARTIFASANGHLDLWAHNLGPAV